MEDIISLRERYQQVRPYKLAVLADGSPRAGKVEIISYPWDEGGAVRVKVRLIPGDPTSMIEVNAADLRFLS